MKIRTIISLMILSFLMIIFLPAASSVAEGGLLPSLTETVGIAMPSLGEALGRYPDEEKGNRRREYYRTLHECVRVGFQCFQRLS